MGDLRPSCSDVDQKCKHVLNSLVYAKTEQTVLSRNKPVQKMFTFWSSNVKDGHTFLLNADFALLIRGL